MSEVHFNECPGLCWESLVALHVPAVASPIIVPLPSLPPSLQGSLLLRYSWDPSLFAGHSSLTAPQSSPEVASPLLH